MGSPSPQIRCLLTIRPYKIEQAFWRSYEPRRLLLATDTITCVLSFVTAVLAIHRLVTAAPTTLFTTYLGPHNVLFNVGVLAVMYQASAALPVLAMVLKPGYYYKHRLALCLLNRLLRLCLLVCQMMSPQAVGHIYRAIAARSQLDEIVQVPIRALLVHVLHPATFWMMQSFFIIPWRWACVLQLIQTVAVGAYYSAALPCLMKCMLLQPSGSAHTQFADEAVTGCELFHVVSSVAWMTLGDPAFLVQQDVCAGLRAVQVLQLFATIVCLFILPLGFMYITEGLLKHRFLESLQPPQQVPAEAEHASSRRQGLGYAGMVGSSSSAEEASGSSSSRQGTVGRYLRHMGRYTSMGTLNDISGSVFPGSAAIAASIVVENSRNARADAPAANTCRTLAAASSSSSSDHSTQDIAGDAALMQRQEGVFGSNVVWQVAYVALLLLPAWTLSEFLVDKVFDRSCKCEL